MITRQIRVTSIFLLIIAVGTSNTVYAEPMDAQIKEVSKEISDNMARTDSIFDHAISAYNKKMSDDKIEKEKNALESKRLRDEEKKEQKRRKEERNKEIRDKNSRNPATVPRETELEKVNRLIREGKLKPPSSVENSLDLRDGVIVSEETSSIVATLAEIYKEIAKRDLKITSYFRDAKKQSKAMYGLAQRHGDEYVQNLYKNKVAVKQILDAKREHPKNKRKAIKQMTTVIEQQMAKGVFISNHLIGLSFDASGNTDYSALQIAVKKVGGSFFFEGGNHYHIDLRGAKIKYDNTVAKRKYVKVKYNKVAYVPGKKPTVAEVRNIFYPGKKTKDLTSQERKQLLNNYISLLKEKTTLAWLIAITKVEGAPSPYTVVGFLPKSGYRLSKTPDCQRRIAKLTLKAHPKEQKLPQRCFERTSAGPTSASGYGQFVYKTFVPLKKGLKLKNFSRKSQALAMLELGRQSSVEGFTGLVQGNLKTAVKATTPWAGSTESSLPGKKRDILKVAKQEQQKLKGAKYYQDWLNEFMDDSTS